MKLKLECNRVLVKPIKSEIFSMGDDMKKVECTGIIIDKGGGFVNPDRTVVPTPFNIGDNVVFSMYAGTNILINGEPHLIMRDGDIYFSYSE